MVDGAGVTFDPYEVLGLARDATERSIRAARREKVKAAHPDGGGTSEEFHRVNLAAQILLDAARRKRFDETGTSDDKPPDNQWARAVGLMSDFVLGHCNEYVMKNLEPSLDPRRHDLMHLFREKMNADMSAISASLASGDKALRFWRDMGDRFTTDDKVNVLRRSMEDCVRAVEASIERLKQDLADRQFAIALAAKYGFRVDANQPQPMQCALVGSDGRLIMVVRTA